MKPVNRNPPVRPTVPLDPPQPADVTHRPRSCHGGQNAHTRADNSRHVSHVTLRNTHTQTHTNIEFDVQLQRRTTAVLLFSVLPSEGSSARTESASGGSLTFTVAQPVFNRPTTELLRVRTLQMLGSSGNPQTQCGASELLNLVGGAHT